MFYEVAENGNLIDVRAWSRGMGLACKMSKPMLLLLQRKRECVPETQERCLLLFASMH